MPEYTKEERQRMQKAFGYTYESLRDAILPMAKNGGEGTSAMGIDTPLAALATDHQPLFNYFKQLFFPDEVSLLPRSSSDQCQVHRPQRKE